LNIRSLFKLVFLLLFTNMVSAQLDIDQIKVNYVCYQKALPRVLTEISMQNQVNLAYSVSDIPAKPISINAKNISLRETLEYVLEGTGLMFETVEYNVVIFKESVYANTRYTISGYVKDELTGERLLYADVYLDDLSESSSTNDFGYFNLTVKRGRNKIWCSYVGYEPKEIDLTLRRNLKLDIKMTREEKTLLDEVIITADRTQMESIDFYKPEKVEMDAMDRMVSFGGEDDIMRLMYASPGVLTGADGFGGMHVRGGNADQNQILMDGIPVYNALHAIGLYSVFNGDVIQSTKFMKGDMPARYGGSASSVLDIRTRNGNKTRHRGNFNLGLLTLKAGLEGPIVPGKVSYLLSARRTYADLWINSVREFLNDQQGSTGQTSYYNYDLNAKVHAALNARNNLFFTYYQGADDYQYAIQKEKLLDGQNTLFRDERNEQLTQWGNRLMALKWTTNPTGQVFMDFSLTYSAFDMDNFVLDWVGERENELLSTYRFSERLFLSGIEDLGFHSNIEIYQSGGNILRLGWRTTRHAFSPAVWSSDSERFPDVNSSQDLPSYDALKSSVQAVDNIAWENRIYVENEQEFGKHTRLNIGLHLAHFYIDGDLKYNLEPRVLLNSKISKHTVFNFSATMMSQFLHLLSNNGLGFPSQVWLPSTSTLAPQRSWQVALGFNNQHNQHLGSFIQAYYKNMDRLVMVDAGEQLEISEGNSWDSKLSSGIGFSYGLETGFTYSSRVFHFLVNYGLLYSKRKFEDLNGGLPFDHRFSRRHNLNLGLNYRFNQNIDCSINWTYGTGNPYTFPTQIATFVEDGQVTTKFVYEALNNFNIPDYHRLDFEFNFRSQFTWGEQKFTLGAYNVYNRKNPFYITFDNQTENIDVLDGANFKYVYVFPLVPVLNYSISF
jgi:hypothetical protein